MDMLTELWNQWKDCQRCKLHQGRTHIVFGSGPAHADLMMIGEGPGPHEDQQGEPFIGDAGELLTRVIKSMGLCREDVYLTNIIKCRTPQNRYPELDEIAVCFSCLEKQIRIIQPLIICTLGKCATQTLLKVTTPISELRGQWYNYNGIKLMPTYHPAYLLRNPDEKRLVWNDCSLIQQALQQKIQPSQRLLKIWSGILERIKQQQPELETILRQAIPMELTHDTLTVDFNKESPVIRKFLDSSQNLTILEQAIEEYLGFYVQPIIKLQQQIIVTKNATKNETSLPPDSAKIEKGEYSSKPLEQSQPVSSEIPKTSRQNENIQTNIKSNNFRERFKAEHRCEDGHYVRSKAETLLDNWLYHSGIVHAYERKIPIGEEMYSDFYLPKGNVYIEYWGNNEDNRYLTRKKQKIALYKKYNLSLIEIDDKDISNLDDILPQKILRFGIQMI